MKPGKGACAGLVAIMMLMPKGVWKARSTPGYEIRVIVREATASRTPARGDGPSAPVPASIDARQLSRRRITKRSTAGRSTHQTDGQSAPGSPGRPTASAE
jgi:hypothetical protein